MSKCETCEHYKIFHSQVIHKPIMTCELETRDRGCSKAFVKKVEK